MILYYQKKQRALLNKETPDFHDETMLEHYKTQLATLLKDNESDKLPHISKELDDEPDRTNKKLSNNNVREIMSRIQGTEPQRVIAKDFAVSQTLISFIKTNKSYVNTKIIKNSLTSISSVKI